MPDIVSRDALTAGKGSIQDETHAFLAAFDKTYFNKVGTDNMMKYQCGINFFC